MALMEGQCSLQAEYWLVRVGSAGAGLGARRIGETEIRVEVGWECGAQSRASYPSKQVEQESEQ